MLKRVKEKLTCSRFTLIPLICGFTVLSYGNLFSSNIRDVLPYVLWIVALMESLIAGRIIINRNIVSFFGFGTPFLIIVLLLHLFSSNSYITFGGVYFLVLVSFMLVFCGIQFGSKLNEEDVGVILRWFLIGAIIMGTIYLIDNVANGFNLNSRLYVSSFNKNSASQLISSALCIAILGINNGKSAKNKILRIVVASYLLVILLLMRSRSCILCFGIAVFIILTSRFTSKKIKRWILVIAIAIALVIIYNDNIKSIVINSILLANRDATSLDSITSGRVSIYSRFWDLIRGRELLGAGHMYYECFYLSVIIQFGIPIGLYLCGYVIYVVHMIRIMHADVSYGLLLRVLAISYALNGLFEGLPPFGPGTKNFLLWLLFGVALSHYGRKTQSLRGL